MFKVIFRIVIPILMLGGFIACGGMTPPKSGFLSDYSKLKPNPRYKNSYLYLNPDRNLASYSKFFVEHVKMYLSPEARERGVDPTQLNDLAEYFRNEVIGQLQGKYTQAGFGRREPGTLQVRMAITELKSAGSMSASGPLGLEKEISLGGASAEFELLDYQSGEVVAAGIVSEEEILKSDGTSWGNTRKILSQWAKRFRARLDEAQAGNQ
jgi:hypothetical protein